MSLSFFLVLHHSSSSDSICSLEPHWRCSVRHGLSRYQPSYGYHDTMRYHGLMSYIDTFDHELVGVFAGLPLYHPWKRLTVRAAMNSSARQSTSCWVAVAASPRQPYGCSLGISAGSLATRC